MKKIYIFLICCAFSFAANAQIITTVAGDGTLGFSGDGGQATVAQLSGPLGIVVDALGNYYISEATHRIRKVDVNGVITTIAGTGIGGFSGDNGPATAANLNSPVGMAFDSQGDLYFAEFDNNRIRKITMSTGIITTAAGMGVNGFNGDGGPALLAQISGPTGVCFDALDNMYIADLANARVRRVDNITGIISTVAGDGTATHTGDGGPATQAGIGNVYDVKCDQLGSLIFSEILNQYIRKVTTATGIISTIGGNGTAAFSGDGGPATAASINEPQGIAIDAAGNIFIAELNNRRVRRIDAVTNIITTVAGNGSTVSSGDGGPATSAGLRPGAVATSGTDLLIADFNHRIRKVTNSAVGVEEARGTSSLVSLFPNPANETFFISGIEPNTAVQIFDVNGNVLISEVVSENESIGISGLAQGVYIVVADKKKIRLIKI